MSMTEETQLELVNKNPLEERAALVDRACSLCTVPDETLRDAKRAVERSSYAVSKQPKKARVLGALGADPYRNGDHRHETLLGVKPTPAKI
jgi:hypothetical protein